MAGSSGHLGDVGPTELQQVENAMTLWRWLVRLFRKSPAKERDDEFYSYDQPRQRDVAAAAADNAMNARMNSGGGAIGLLNRRSCSAVD